MSKTVYLLALLALVPSLTFAQVCMVCEDTGTGAPEASACATVNTNLITETCTPGANGCFRSETAEGRVKRGCANSLTPEELDGCEAGNTGCKLCTGDRCNTKENFQQCYSCNSVDQDCPQIQTGQQNLVTCTNYPDQCAIFMDGNNIIRGCEMEIPHTLPATCGFNECNRCSENGCNGIRFPPNRQQCNICTGSVDECFGDLATTTTQQRVCNNYAALNPRCYTVLTPNRQVFRGCMNDGDEGVTSCNANPGACLDCTANFCNNAAVRWAPQLSCIRCPFNDVLCAWGFSAGEATACTNNVWLGQTEMCYHRLMATGGVERGCALDMVGQCAADDDTCGTCQGNGCNRNTFNFHKCLQCRSSIDENCKDPEQSEMEPQTCPGREQRLTDIGCYVLEQDNGNVVRGCLSNIDADLLAECRRGDRCEICETDGCNTQPFGGAGAIKAVSFVLMVITALFMQMF